MEEKKENKSQAIIEVTDCGPIRITGRIILKDLKRDKEDIPSEILLCGCGKSKRQPFCDDSHKQ